MEILEKLATFEGAVIFLLIIIVYALGKGFESINESLQDIKESIEELND